MKITVNLGEVETQFSLFRDFSSVTSLGKTDHGDSCTRNNI